MVLAVRRRWPDPAAEHHEQAQTLVPGEPVVRAGFDEQRLSLFEWRRAALDLECPPALEHDVELVVFMRLLPVGFGCDEDVDADLEAWGLVHDLVAAAGLAETPARLADLDRLHGRRLSRRLGSRRTVLESSERDLDRRHRDEREAPADENLCPRAVGSSLWKQLCGDHPDHRSGGESEAGGEQSPELLDEQ